MSELFYLPPEKIELQEKTAVLTGGEWQHAAKVMRLKTGDEISFFDGNGHLYSGVISSQQNKAFTIQINTIEEKTRAWQLSVFVGLSGGSKMDFIVRALTEAGATAITGFFAQYSDIKRIAAGKEERLRKIAIEACKQSERAFLPRIEMPLSFNRILESLAEFETKVVFYERAKNFLLASAFKSKNIALVIGPKGGFSEEEIKQLQAKGVLVSSLNDAVLKVETAAITAAGLIRYFQSSSIK